MTPKSPLLPPGTWKTRRRARTRSVLVPRPLLPTVMGINFGSDLRRNLQFPIVTVTGLYE